MGWNVGCPDGSALGAVGRMDGLLRGCIEGCDGEDGFLEGRKVGCDKGCLLG